MRMCVWSSDVGSSDLSKASPGSDGLPNWRSQYNLQVRIKRVIQGKENRHIVPASAIAHAQIRDDRDFLAVLRPDGEGGYTLMTANLWAYRPKISGPCSSRNTARPMCSLSVDRKGVGRGQR